MPERPDITVPEHAERAPASTGAAQQHAGPAPAEPFTAAPPKPDVPPPAETAFTDADVAPAPQGERPAADSEDDAAAEEVDYLALAQRTQADFENYRKRAARDMALAADRGVKKLAEGLLPALDHLDVALAAIEDPEVVKGLRLVQDEFARALEKVGVEAFSPQGEIFDPNEHEAVAQQEGEGVASGHVVSVYQQGYRLNGLLLRPARVVVAP